MNRGLFFLCCFFLSASFFPASTMADQTKGKLEAQMEDKIVGRADWIEHVLKRVDTYFCEPKGYFMSCFEVSELQCGEVVTTTARSCVQELQGKIPPELNREDRETWGVAVGRCVGSNYGMTLKDKKLGEAKCNDIDAWQ